MKSTSLKNLLTGGLLAALAAFALSGCATSKQHSAARGCNDCETKWVAVQKPSALPVANTSAHFGSVVSPIGDAPGERDLAYAQTWQWERQQFCGAGEATAALATSPAR